MQVRRTIIRTDGATRHGGRYRQQHWNRQAPHVADSQQRAARRRWAVYRPARVAPQNRNRRAPRRSAPRATFATSFVMVPPCLRDFQSTLWAIARALSSLLSWRRSGLLNRGSRDPDLLALVDRVGWVGDDARVVAESADNLDLGSEVARNADLLEDNPVVGPEDRDLGRIVAKQQRIGRKGHRVGIRRELKMHARECARGERAILIIREEFDQQRARFLVDRMRG